MTKRITPDEARRTAKVFKQTTRYSALVDWLLRLATQMEADEQARNADADDTRSEAWQVLELTAERDALVATMIANEAERDELAASNEIFMRCLDRARELWQGAHPEKKLMWPDGAESIVWLLERCDTLAAKVAELTTLVRAVRASEFYGIRLGYVDGKDWVDARGEVMK